MTSIRYEFCELPAIWEGDFRAGLFNGVAQIEYVSDGEWVVSSIAIDFDNHKTGAEARKQTHTLLHYHALREPLMDALVHFHGDHITAQVAIARAEPSRLTLQHIEAAE